MLPRCRRYLRALLALCTTLSAASTPAHFETRGVSIANSGPISIAVGDFNHDGFLDLAVAAEDTGEGENNIVVFLGNGDGTFRREAAYTVGVVAVSVVAADFDGDGNLDLAVANRLSSYISILLGNGDGTFRPGPQNPQVAAPQNFVTVGDFNGDGIPDLVGFSDNNPCKCLSVLLGNGDGTFQAAVVTDPPFNIGSIGLGDFNGDGNLDVVTAGDNSVNDINVLLGNGDGTFQYGASYPGDFASNSIAVADFNGDHKPDLAIANIGGVAVLLGNGDGTFQTEVEYPANAPYWVAAGDFSGNGKMDLVAAVPFRSNSGASFFVGNGDGTFKPGVLYPAGEQTAYVAVGDFNGDRKPDLVLACNFFESIYVLLNTGAVKFSPTTPLNFKTQAVGTTSGPQTVTLTNTGTGALKIASMKASAEFGVTSTCGASVAAGASCTISATFSPTKKGSVQGTITIIDSASTKPQVIELLGTGT
jgi:hypothetical protein